MSTPRSDGLPLGCWSPLPQARVAPLAPNQRSRFTKLVLWLLRRRTRSAIDFTVFTTFARLGSIFPAHLVLVSQLLRDGHLRAQEKEQVILRIAWRTGCTYEWGHHRHTALQLGVSRTRLDAIAQDNVEDLPPRLQAMMTAADLLVAHHVLDDAAWAHATELLTHDEILELCLLVGHYLMVALTLNSTGVQLEEPFRGELQQEH